MAEMLPSAPVESDDGYRIVASVLLLSGLVDDVGGGGGSLQRPEVNRKRKGVIRMIAILTSLTYCVSIPFLSSGARTTIRHRTLVGVKI